MEFNKKAAMKKWDEIFGHVVEAHDFAGRRMLKGAYGQPTSSVGWVLTCILPKSEGGKPYNDNLTCMHVTTADEKADLFPSFVANDIRYNIVSGENGKWSIEQAKDDEAIAEQEAKTSSALERWETFFGADCEETNDFSGRKIVKSEFGTENENSWKIAPYVTSKPTENKNAYIANIQTIEEALGKTAFRANGKQFTLNKENGSYYFKELEMSVPKRSFDLGNPYSVAERISRSMEEFASPDNSHVWLDFIIVSAVTSANAGDALAGAFTDTLSFILREQVGAWMSFDVSEMIEDDGTRHMFITYRFTSPQVTDIERFFNAAMLLNTYSVMLVEKFGLSVLKFYNYAGRFLSSQIHYSTALLAGYNPEFQSLMSGIYQGGGGFYEGESPTTLYCSRSVIYNVPALAENFNENSPLYTDAQMAEHNYIFSGLRESIEGYLNPAPEPTVPSAPTVSPSSPVPTENTSENEANKENTAEEQKDDSEIVIDFDHLVETNGYEEKKEETDFQNLVIDPNNEEIK